MKATMFGAIGGATIVLLIAGLFGHDRAVLAQRPGGYESPELIALSTAVDGKTQQITVIDPARRAICVYHVDLPTGSIALKSVRNIYGDLQIDDFNGLPPKPNEIR